MSNIITDSLSEPAAVIADDDVQVSLSDEDSDDGPGGGPSNKSAILGGGKGGCLDDSIRPNKTPMKFEKEFLLEALMEQQFAEASTQRVQQY